MLYDKKRNETQKAIKSSLLNIMESKDISRITVTDLCNNIGITRSTFYQYYRDIDMLYEEIKKTTLYKLFGEPEFFFEKHKEMENVQMYVAHQIFSYIWHHQSIFTILITKDKLFINDIYNIFKEKYLYFFEYTLISKNRYQISKTFLAEYIASAYTGIIYEWVISEYDMTMDEIIRMMTFINSNGPLSMLEVSEK